MFSSIITVNTQAVTLKVGLKFLKYRFTLSLNVSLFLHNSNFQTFQTSLRCTSKLKELLTWKVLNATKPKRNFSAIKRLHEADVLLTNPTFVCKKSESGRTPVEAGERRWSQSAAPSGSPLLI